MEFSEREYYDESETDAEYSDDLQEDSSFDVVEETRLTLSNLSLKRKVKRLKNEIVGETNEKEEEEEGELDKLCQESYEIIRKIIEGGQLERLKVEDCKIYLRKHGLRLSGKKETLIQRIKEHIDIVNGGGEKKYPASSFVLNCKGDACMGDVVMFEQNVYEEFNIASHSAKGGLCGTRVVVGRILKESYGAAKQQHTFTIEVLWSKGEKPLPSLHPLLIKGRNLYRLKTMRQKWEDEGERQKILLEKHARGCAARSNREARIQERENRKMQKQNRETRNEPLSRKQEEENREPLPPSVRVKPEKLIHQPKQQQQQKVHYYTRTCESNIPIQTVNLHEKPNYILNAHVQPVHQRQPLITMNCSLQKSQYTGSQVSNFYSSKRTWESFLEEEHVNYRTAISPIQGRPTRHFQYYNHIKFPVQQHTFKENEGYNSMRNPLRGFSHVDVHPHSQQSHMQISNAGRNPSAQQQGNEQKQKCQYFVQGRCHFGGRCKYLHELAGNK